MLVLLVTFLNKTQTKFIRLVNIFWIQEIMFLFCYVLSHSLLYYTDLANSYISTTQITIHMITIVKIIKIPSKTNKQKRKGKKYLIHVFYALYNKIITLI